VIWKVVLEGAEFLFILRIDFRDLREKIILDIIGCCLK
jgi:hypothetical protein